MAVSTEDFGGFDLIAAVANADAATQAEILAQIKYAQQGRSHTPTTPSALRAWDVVRDVTREPRPLDKFMESYKGGHKRTEVLQALDLLTDYANEGSRQALNVQERHMVMRLMVEVLFDHINGWVFHDREEMSSRRSRTRNPGMHKVTAAQLVEHIDALPKALDDAFPGYYEARLIGRVALMRTAA